MGLCLVCELCESRVIVGNQDMVFCYATAFNFLIFIYNFSNIINSILDYSFLFLSYIYQVFRNTLTSYHELRNFFLLWCSAII